MALLPPPTRLEASRAWWVGVPLALVPFAFAFGPVMGGLIAGELAAFTLAVGFELSRPILKKPSHDRGLAIAVLSCALAPVVALIAFLIVSENPKVKAWVEAGDVGVVFVAGFLLEALVSIVALWFILKRRGTPLDYKGYRVAVFGTPPVALFAAGGGNVLQTFALGLLVAGSVGFLLLGWLRTMRPRQEVKFDPIFAPTPTATGTEQPVFQAFRSR
ncbi:MAG: hypothetical protein HYT80_10385 [Euryarchaeota archaeon]|nr:hypothetical protein [Euryarchaeota archaeon]